MDKLQEFVPQSALHWSQPRALQEHYELRAGSTLAGTLQFRNSFGTFAAGETAEGRWTFKRVGFFRQVVSLRAAGSDADLAVFQNQTWSGGGSIELPGGRRFLATTNMWQTRFEWSRDDGELYFRFQTGGLIRQTADVDVTPAGAAAPELSPLLLLAWYLAVMMARDSSDVAATIAST